MRNTKNSMPKGQRGFYSLLLTIIIFVPFTSLSQVSESWTFNYVDADPYNYEFPADNLPKCYAQNDSGYQVYGISANIENANSGGDGNEWVVTDSVGGLRRKFHDGGEYDYMDAQPVSATGFVLLNDVQIMAINNHGVIQWSHSLPFQSFRTSAIDGNGDIWILGVQSSDPLLCKYTSTGSFVSAYRISTAINDYYVDFCIQQNGNLRLLTANANSVSNLISLSPSGVILDQIQYNYPFSRITNGPDHSFYLAGGQRVMRCDTMGQPIWYQAISTNLTPSFPFLSQENIGLEILPNQSVAMAIRDVCYGGVYPDLAANGPFPWESGRVYIFAPDGQITYATRIAPGYPSNDPANNGLFALDLDKKGRLVVGHHVGETFIGICQLGYCVYEYQDLYVQFDKICPPRNLCLSSTYAKSVQPVTPLPTISPLSATAIPTSNPSNGGVTVSNSNIIYAISGPSCTACLPPSPTIGYIQDSLSFIFWVEPWAGNEDTLTWFIGGTQQGHQPYFHHSFPTNIIPEILLEVRGTCGTGRDTLQLSPCHFASFFPSMDTLCVNDSITATNTSFQSLSNQWYLNGYLVSNQTHPIIALPDTGINIIQLVADNGYCTDTINDSVITIAPINLTGFVINPSLLTVQFQDTSQNANAWLWDFGDGTTSTLRNPTHTYAIGGNYPICLTVNFVCGQQTVCDTFSCFPPEMDWEIVVRWDTIWAINQSVRYDSLLWTLPDGSNSQSDTVIYITGESGLFQISLQGWSDCGSIVLNRTVTTYNHADTTNVLFKVVDTLNTNGLLTGAREMADGAVVSVGYEDKAGNGKDMVVIRQDGAGNFLWAKTYGGILDDRANGMVPLPDGSFLVCGNTHSIGAGNSDATVLRINKLGNMQWQRTFGGAGMDQSMKLEESPDGNYVVVGGIQDTITAQIEMWAAKLDSSGAVLWSNRIPGDWNAVGIDLEIGAEGQIYILSQVSAPVGSTNYCLNYIHNRLYKLGADGSLLSALDLGEGKTDFKPVFSTLALGDGLLVLGGYADYSDASLVTGDNTHNYRLSFPFVAKLDTGVFWPYQRCNYGNFKAIGHYFLIDHAVNNIPSSWCGATTPVGGSVEQLVYMGDGKFNCMGTNQIRFGSQYRSHGQFVFTYTPISHNTLGNPFTFIANHWYLSGSSTSNGTRKFQQLELEKSGVIIGTGIQLLNHRRQWLVKTKSLMDGCKFYSQSYPLEKDIFDYCIGAINSNNQYFDLDLAATFIDTVAVVENRYSIHPGDLDQPQIDRRVKSCVSSCEQPIVNLSISITNDTLSAQVLPQAGVTYRWNVNGQFQGTGHNFNYVFTRCGVNEVELIAENNCGRILRHIRHSIELSNSLHIGNDTTLCHGDSIVLETPPGWSYTHWSTGSLDSAITIKGAGMYSLQAQDSSGCFSKDTISILYTSPDTLFNIGPDTTLCIGDTLRLWAPIGYNPIQWSTGSSATSLLAQTPGTYWITVWDSLGCSLRDTIRITAFPAYPINLPPVIEFCEGDTFRLDAPAGFTNPRWTTGSMDTFILGTNPGFYGLTAANPYGCYVSSTTMAIHQPPPTAVFLANGLQFVGTGVVQVQWYRDSILIPGANYSPYPPTQNGQYYAHIQTTLGCSYFTNSVTLVLTGTNELTEHSSPAIFPNPTANHLTIQLGTAPSTPWRATLHNALGQAILSQSFERDVEQATLDMSKLAEGPYWIRIEMGSGEIWVEKIEILR